MSTHFQVTIVIFIVVLTSQGCDPSTTPAPSFQPVADTSADTDIASDPGVQVITGTITLRAEQGVVFSTGVVARGTVNNSDLHATSGGGYPRLATGGDTITNTAPVIWYSGLSSLEDVPTHDIPTGKGISLPQAEPGDAFVALAYISGGVVRGYVVDVPAADTVVIEYELTR